MAPASTFPSWYHVPSVTSSEGLNSTAMKRLLLRLRTSGTTLRTPRPTRERACLPPASALSPVALRMSCADMPPLPAAKMAL
jgi:hypothetical protein